jgi:hypothetical protein
MWNNQKRIFILGALLMYAIISGAADTLKIHLTYRHKLDSTGHSTGRVTINQKIHTPDDVLLREINFDQNSGQISGYIFYFYKHGRLFTAECYNQADSLQYIQKYEYDQDGNVILITKLVPGEKGMISVEKTIRDFDSSGKLVEEGRYFGKKPGIRTKYEYSPAGYLHLEYCKAKPISGLTYTEEIRSYSYTAGNVLIRKDVTGKALQGEPYPQHEDYEYDDHGRLSAVKTFSSSNVLVNTRLYQYLSGSTVGYYEERGPDGIVDVIIEYDYRKHYMDPGTQVSRYEDF